MSGPLHQLGLRNPEPVREGVEPDGLRLAQRGLPLAAVAVPPFHEVNFLARRLHEFAEKQLFVVGEIHDLAAAIFSADA